jgi:hypothetical protein
MKKRELEMMLGKLFRFLCLCVFASLRLRVFAPLRFVPNGK